VREKQKLKVSQQILAHKTQIHGTSDLPTYLARFDTDSFKIEDTLCSRTMSGNKDHFEDMKPYNGNNVKGIAGGLKIEATRTNDSGAKDKVNCSTFESVLRTSTLYENPTCAVYDNSSSQHVFEEWTTSPVRDSRFRTTPPTSQGGPTWGEGQTSLCGAPPMPCDARPWRSAHSFWSRTLVH
jgi:hypothetical protein